MIARKWGPFSKILSIHIQSCIGAKYRFPWETSLTHYHIQSSFLYQFLHECPPTNCLSPTNKLTWPDCHGRVQHQSSQRLIVFSMVPPCLIWLVWMPNFSVKTLGEIHISPITTCLFCQFVFCIKNKLSPQNLIRTYIQDKHKATRKK